MLQYRTFNYCSIFLIILFYNKNIVVNCQNASNEPAEIFFVNNNDFHRFLEQVEIINVKLDLYNEHVDKIVCANNINHNNNNNPIVNPHHSADVNVDAPVTDNINGRININDNFNNRDRYYNDNRDSIGTQNIRTLPTNCAEALKHITLPHNEENNRSGIYQLYIPDSGLKPFYVYCLQDKTNNGGAWTIIQRRSDNSTNFDRDWKDFEQGFGNLENEHFLGLKKLHALTNWQKHELWIELGDFSGNRSAAYYETFAIDNANTNYTLNVLGKYYGDAGDSLRRQQGQMFSTKDRDIGEFGRSCAIMYRTGWWHEKCFESNLNGVHYNGTYKHITSEGIIWKTWQGFQYSLKYTHMAIRPVQQK